MTDSVFHIQQEFLKACEMDALTLPAEKLAVRLVQEECDELMDCGYYNVNEPDNNAIKEAIDLMYVTAQFLNVTVGASLALSLFKAVHANNMTKATDGVMLKRKDGKVLKNENYVKFDINDWLRE